MALTRRAPPHEGRLGDALGISQGLSGPPLALARRHMRGRAGRFLALIEASRAPLKTPEENR